jgi:hypothetical protein
MYHLNRRRRNLDIAIYPAADEFAAPQRQRRTNPLARRNKRVPQRLFQLTVYLLNT